MRAKKIHTTLDLNHQGLLPRTTCSRHEDELYAMIHELTFSRNRNDFQQKLHSDADKEYDIYGLLHDEVLFISNNI